jgi:hypothetical protein
MIKPLFYNVCKPPPSKNQSMSSLVRCAGQVSHSFPIHLVHWLSSTCPIQDCEQSLPAAENDNNECTGDTEVDVHTCKKSEEESLLTIIEMLEYNESIKAFTGTNGELYPVVTDYLAKEYRPKKSSLEDLEFVDVTPKFVGLCDTSAPVCHTIHFKAKDSRIRVEPLNRNKISIITDNPVESIDIIHFKYNEETGLYLLRIETVYSSFGNFKYSVSVEDTIIPTEDFVTTISHDSTATVDFKNDNRKENLLKVSGSEEFFQKWNSLSDEEFETHASENLNETDLFGFSVLTHFSSRFFYHRTKILIKTGHNPCQFDYLGRDAFYWSEEKLSKDEFRVMNKILSKMKFVTMKDYISSCFEMEIKVDDLFGEDLGYIQIDCFLEDAIFYKGSKDANNHWFYNKNTGIDWELHGGQILHLVYLAEKALYQWRSFHQNLHLLYFKNCLPSFTSGMSPRMKGLYILARHILFEHFSRRMNIECHVFETNWCISNEYSEHMRRERPMFVCVPYLDQSAVTWNLCTHSTSVVVKLSTSKDHLMGFQIQRKSRIINKKCSNFETIWIPDFVTDTLVEKVYPLTINNTLQDSILKSLVVACNHIRPSKLEVYSIVTTLFIQPSLNYTQRATPISIYYPSLNTLLDRMYLILYLNRSNYDESSLDIFDGKLCHSILRDLIISENIEHSINSKYHEYADKIFNCCNFIFSNISKQLENNVPEYNTTTLTITEFNFTEEAKLTTIKNSLVRHRDLLLKDVTEYPASKTKSTESIFQDIFHWHSKKKIDQYKQNHDFLLGCANKLKQRRSLISVFPYVDALSVTHYQSLLHREIVAQSKEFQKYFNEIKDLKFKIHTDDLPVSSEHLPILQAGAEKMEYDEEQDNYEQLSKIYEYELMGFIDQLRKLIKLSKWNKWNRNELSQLDEKKRVYLWKIFCWCRFIREFTRLKKRFLIKGHRDITFDFIEKCLQHIPFDISTANILHLEMIIKHRTPTPAIEEYQNKKKEMYQEIDSQIKEAVLKMNNYAKVRDLLIKKSIISSLSFIPDGWQRSLMHHIENNRNVLVSAPTSSGKTFISYYLIRLVLSRSSRGLVVFIVPTNALVNQIYMDLYTTLGRKKIDKSFDDTTIGIYTKYQRVNLSKCQVLISTPQMFEILLLSQTLEAEELRNRLSYLILDEVHNMNSEAGEVWEHIIMMTKCPILALSATLGNPKLFQNWLKTIRKSKVELVKCRHRFVPLSYFLYSDNNLIDIHPLAALNSEQIKEEEIDRLEVLGIKECLSFLSIATEEFKGTVNPFESFCDGTKLGSNGLEYITRDMIIEFQSSLTKLIQSKFKDAAYQTHMVNICHRIREPITMSNNNIEDLVSNGDYFRRYHLNLIQHLKDKQLLPSICFIFDKLLINNIVEHICKKVEKNSLCLFSDPIPNRLQIEHSIENLKKIDSLPNFAIKALRAGIGMHYASLDPVYQEEVERLLKANCLPLVYATSTLALGVNMPVKSVIMGKESTYMNQVTFNQCSGRAGRRGLEIFGHVIFFDIRLPRIYRYLNAKIPSIKGSHGITPSFILRLLVAQNELNNQKKRPSVDKQKMNLKIFEFNDLIVNHLISPLLSMMENNSNSSVSDKMKYLFRFNIEFLYRIGMINSLGQPLSYSGVITHLHYTEPYNLLFAYFMKNSLFHKIIDQSDSEKQILILMCYLFGRNRVSGFRNESSFLPAPPDIFIKYAEIYNEIVLNIYSDNVYASSNNIEQTLPGSNLSVINQPDTVTSEFKSVSKYAALSGNQSRSFHSFKHFVSTTSHASITTASVMPFASFYDPDISAFLLDYFECGSRSAVIDKYKFLNENEFDKLVLEFAEKLSAVYYGLCNQRILIPKDIFMKKLFKIQSRFRTLLNEKEEEEEEELEDIIEDFIEEQNTESQEQETDEFIDEDSLTSLIDESALTNPEDDDVVVSQLLTSFNRSHESEERFFKWRLLFGIVTGINTCRNDNELQIVKSMEDQSSLTYLLKELYGKQPNREKCSSIFKILFGLMSEYKDKIKKKCYQALVELVKTFFGILQEELVYAHSMFLGMLKNSTICPTLRDMFQEVFYQN